jgi:glycosyltransferase involved in cell wall biosynthesis
VLLGTHGTFATYPTPPDFSKRGNPDQRILAIGHWGTYKRLEALMAAFPLVLKKAPHARLVIAGANHHTKPGYWESIRAAQPPELPIDFRGYVPEEDIPELYQTTSVVVMPYDSATGSSGPAHQACEYGVPIVCADIPDFREMAAEEDMAILFHKVGNAEDLADRLVSILESPQREREMAEHNFVAGIEMTLSNVVNKYLRWFELQRCKKLARNAGTIAEGLAFAGGAGAPQVSAFSWPSRLPAAGERNEIFFGLDRTRPHADLGDLGELPGPIRAPEEP